MAEASAIVAKLEKEVLCPICLEGYSDKHNIPKALSCQHTLCQVCLQKFIDSEEGSYFKCPTCRENIKIPHEGANGFINNLTVMSILGYMSTGRDASSSSLSNSCDPCEELIKSKEVVCVKHSLPASHFCLPCKQLLCYKCLGIIIQHQGHHKHQIVEIEEAREGKLKLDLQRKIQHLKYLQKVITKTKTSTQRDIDDICKKGMEDIVARADEMKNMVKAWEKESKAPVIKAVKDMKADVSETAEDAEDTIETLLESLQQVSDKGDFLECIHEQATSTKAVIDLECSIQNMELIKQGLSVELTPSTIKYTQFGQVTLDTEKDRLDPHSPSTILSPISKGVKYYLALSIQKIDACIFPNIYDYQEILGCVANGIPTVKSIVKNFHQKHQIVQEYALIFDKYHLMNETQMNDLSDNMSALNSAYLVIKPNSDVIVQQHFSSKNSAKESQYRTYELRKKLPLNSLSQYPMRTMTGMLLAANNDIYLQKEMVHNTSHHRGSRVDSGSLIKWFYLSIVSAVNPCDCFLLRDAAGQEERFNNSSGILTCLAPHHNYVVVLDKTSQLISVYDEKGLFKKRADYKESYAKAMCMNEEDLLFVFHSPNYINVLNDDLSLIHVIRSEDLGLGDYPLAGISCGLDKLQVIFLSGYKKCGMAAYSLSSK